MQPDQRWWNFSKGAKLAAKGVNPGVYIMGRIDDSFAQEDDAKEDDAVSNPLDAKVEIVFTTDNEAIVLYNDNTHQKATELDEQVRFFGPLNPFQLRVLTDLIKGPTF